MSRISRLELLYGGCYVHVISRSIRKLKLFQDNEDFEFFMGLLKKAKSRAGFRIYHYCLMQTHFHLAVRMEDPEEFSWGIRDVKRDYACKFHDKYRLSGPVWRERYKSLLVEDERYLYMCGKYIEENPVKAGLVREGMDWKYSSSRHYALGEQDNLIDKYDEGVEARGVEGLSLDEEDFERGSVIGSGFFKFQFFQSRKQPRPVPSE